MSANRLKVLLVSLLAVFAISAVASGSASAECLKVVEAGKGEFEKSTCTGAAGTKEYIKATLVGRLQYGEWCAKVEVAKAGKYSNAACTEEKVGETEKEYIKVLVPCFKVVEPGTGNKDGSCVTNEGATKNEYINVAKVETELKSHVWCAKVAEKETGNYEDNKCTKKVAKKEFIKVWVHFYKPGFWICHKVKEFEGVFKDRGCNIVGGKENWTWAYVTANKVIHACVRAAKGQYEDAYCQWLGGVEKWEWKKWGKVLRFPGTIGASKLKGTVAGVKITIECTGGTTTTGALEENGASKENVLTYTGCKIVGELGVKCKVKETLVTEKLTGTQTPIGEAEGRTEDTFVPEESGGSFIAIAVETNGTETCTPKGTYKVTGSQGCEVDKSNAEAKESQEEHELICKTTGSKLELGGKEATYEGTVTNKLEIENEESKVETDEYFVEE